MIGKELGQYKLLAEIGRGGMGIVYKAYQGSLNREVALKILPPTLSIDKNLVSRFHREAESAAKLSHPNIVQIFDINEKDGIHFFAMEYLKGQNLTQKLEKEGALPIKEALRIAIAVADALNYSHAEGLIHRDIKPGNIMINPHGHVKVTDFGLARLMESSRLTMTGTIIGTPEYMSPEQARGDPLDGRSDLYSLGIVLYEALTAKLPFTATTPFAVAQKQIYDPLPSPCSIRPEIGGGLGESIIKVTEKDPGQRYQSGEDFKKDLQVFFAGTGLERITPTVAVPPGASQIQRNRLKPILGGGIAAAAIILILALFFGPRIKEMFLQEPEEVDFIAEEESEVVPPLVVTEKPPSEDEARKIIEDVRQLSADGAYSDAMSRLEEFMERFPDHPQTNFIPQWIEELRDREVGGKFQEAQKVADKGEIVQAILQFSQIAREYPETEWEAKCNRKVEELENTLKEGEAKKEFLEAQELKRKKNFIEATQLYQNIISRFPESSWAKRSEKEIAKLKEAQARLREKRSTIDRRLQKRELLSFVRDIEHLTRSDRRIKRFFIGEDAEGLAQYLKKNYPDEIERRAEEIGMDSEEFLSEVTDMMIKEAKRQFERPEQDLWRREPLPEFRQPPGEAGKLVEDREMKEDFRPKEEPRPEDKFFEKFKKKVQSNKNARSYIKRRDMEGLWVYMMRRYYREIKEMSKELDRPFRDMAWELSERLIHEREGKR